MGIHRETVLVCMPYKSEQYSLSFESPIYFNVFFLLAVSPNINQHKTFHLIDFMFFIHLFKRCLKNMKSIKSFEQHYVSSIADTYNTCRYKKINIANLDMILYALCSFISSHLMVSLLAIPSFIDLTPLWSQQSNWHN